MQGKLVAGLVALGLLVSGCSALSPLDSASTSPEPSVSGAQTPSAGGSSGAAAPEASAHPVVAVIDASGSMTADDAGDGITRMVAAQRAVSELFDGLPENTPAGLVGYGTLMHGDEVTAEQGCADVEVVSPLAPVDAAGLKAKVDALSAGGWTPIGPALREAAKQLGGQPGRIVLVSDGKNTCEAEPPCEVAKQLKAENAGLTISVVSLRTDEDQVRCVAESTGGYYTTADNEPQLIARAKAAVDAVAALAKVSPSGAYGIKVGDSVTDIAAHYPEFPSLASGTSATWNGETVTIVVWRDCEWVFKGQELISIGSGSGAATTATVDGIGVGSAVAEAERFLGNPIAEETDGADAVRIYPATQTGLYWRLYVDAGLKVRVIYLCRCAPKSAGGDLVLSFEGLGPYKIGATDLVARGAMVPNPEPCFGPYKTNDELLSRGVQLSLGFASEGQDPAKQPLVEVLVRQPEGGEVVPVTYAGAAAGMTIAEVRRRHSDMRVETKQGNGGPLQVGVVRSGEREMVFLIDWDQQPLSDDDTVQQMMVRDWDSGIYWEC